MQNICLTANISAFWGGIHNQPSHMHTTHLMGGCHCNHQIVVPGIDSHWMNPSSVSAYYSQTARITSLLLGCNWSACMDEFQTMSHARNMLCHGRLLCLSLIHLTALTWDAIYTVFLDLSCPWLFWECGFLDLNAHRYSTNHRKPENTSLSRARRLIDTINRNKRIIIITAMTTPSYWPKSYQHMRQVISAKRAEPTNYGWIVSATVNSINVLQNSIEGHIPFYPVMTAIMTQNVHQ